MRFFKLVAKNINVAPLLDEIRQNERAWDFSTKRETMIAAQRHTNSIYLRRAKEREDIHINQNHECISTQASALFPLAVHFMSTVAKTREAELSRAMIVRLKPRAFVSSHIDVGTYYFIRDRYHLVIQSLEGSMLKCGNEQVRMMPGELWWFDNKQYHEAYNPSDLWRVHYIFDLLPNSLKSLAVNPLPKTRQIDHEPVP